MNNSLNPEIDFRNAAFAKNIHTAGDNRVAIRRDQPEIIKKRDIS